MAATYRTALVALVVAPLLGCASGLDAGVAIGQIEHPGNTQVPLPPGQWTMLAQELATTGSVLGGGIDNGHSARVYYAMIENGRIVRVLYVRTSEGAPNSYGYATGADCLANRPSDYLYLRDARSGTPNSVDCLQVKGGFTFRPPSAASAALYRQAYQAAQSYGGLPQTGIQVEIAQAHNQRFETSYIYFFPDQSSATRLSDWKTAELSPDRRRYVDGIVDWAKGFREAVRLGTDHRL